MPKLVILGAGGYAYTVRDIAEQLGYDIIAMLDDKLIDMELNKYTNYISPDNRFVVAFGNNEFRLKWINTLEENGARLATIIHPTAYISPKSVIGEGTVVLPHAVINTATVVKRGCIINIGALVDHDCLINDGVHLAPGAIVKGENIIPECSKIESGEVVERAAIK